LLTKKNHNYLHWSKAWLKTVPTVFHLHIGNSWYTYIQAYVYKSHCLLHANLVQLCVSQTQLSHLKYLKHWIYLKFKTIKFCQWNVTLIFKNDKKFTNTFSYFSWLWLLHVTITLSDRDLNFVLNIPHHIELSGQTAMIFLFFF
jgi:hypothetical protein